MNISVPTGYWVMGREGKGDWLFWFLGVPGASDEGYGYEERRPGGCIRKGLGWKHHTGGSAAPNCRSRRQRPDRAWLPTGAAPFPPIWVGIWELSADVFKQTLKAVHWEERATEDKLDPDPEGNLSLTPPPTLLPAFGPQVPPMRLDKLHGRTGDHGDAGRHTCSPGYK